MRIRIFQGLRPDQSVADKVASPPYDVVSYEEALEFCRDNPLSMLHVLRAEVDLPPDTEPCSDAVYAKALSNFQKLQEEGHLIRESEPCLYLYRLRIGEHCQVGLAGLCHVDDYESGIIKKHENTNPNKVNDRAQLSRVLNAHPGPIFLTYHDEETVTRLTEEVMAGQPLFDFNSEDGIRHTVWRITECQAFTNAFEKIPNLYVADGHHRTECAALVSRERRQSNPQHTGTEDYNWFLTVMFPASQLKILPYNRVVSDLNGLSPEEFLQRVREVCEVEESTSSCPTRPGDIQMNLQGQWYGLRLEPEPEADPVSRLDVRLLQDRILDPILSIKDPRTDPRLSFTGGREADQAVARKVESGIGAVGFSLYPVSLEQLLDIADAGQNMPPKSTWFDPKLRSGLFIHTL